METFQQLFGLNSDMSHYLPGASGEELHNTTQVVGFATQYLCRMKEIDSTKLIIVVLTP
jgi:hypothetical protein